MDELDESIIEYVDKGTIRYTTLAKKLNVPLSTVHVRMKKLEKDGTIRYYKGEIDWKKAGLPLTAFVLINTDVSLLKQLKKTQDMMLKELLKMPYVKDGYIITGDADMLIKIIAKDTQHLKEILLQAVDKIEGIVNTKTIIALG